MISNHRRVHKHTLDTWLSTLNIAVPTSFRPTDYCVCVWVCVSVCVFVCSKIRTVSEVVQHMTYNLYEYKHTCTHK